jgi:hypothetical protein
MEVSMSTEVKRFDVLNPVEGKDGKTYWTRIGAMFQNGNGTMSGQLAQYPANGRLVLRVASNRPKGESDESDSE